MIAWETTRVCNLSCVHCRASARKEDYPDELSTEECLSLIDNVASFSSPVIILTGGEPLMRDDIFELAKHGTDKGLRMVMATNGTLMTEDIARKMLESGIKRVSISLDGSTKAIHDKFRRVEGAFEKSLKGIEYAKNVGLDFQINTTITGDNLSELEPIFNLAIELKAAAFHLFLLVRQ